ncbi:MAG: Crp/Fnr family transcriptional regulator [Roseiarcus sp.]
MAEDNNLLCALKPDDFELLAPNLGRARHAAGDVLYEPGDTVNYAYFPCGQALASYRVILPDGRGVETALIGREGAIGGIVSHGRLPAYARAIVQFEGHFLKISSSQLESLKKASSTLNNLFARYADCLLAQVFQSTACNATHSIEQRAAKWMLAALDRIGSAEVSLTQEQLGGLLGVGRSYVSRVMRKLREDGVLKTRRGRVLVVRRADLEARSCDCNTLVREHFEEVLRGVYPTNGEEIGSEKAPASHVSPARSP